MLGGRPRPPRDRRAGATVDPSGSVTVRPGYREGVGRRPSAEQPGQLAHVLDRRQALDRVDQRGGPLVADDRRGIGAELGADVVAAQRARRAAADVGDDHLVALAARAEDLDPCGESRREARVDPRHVVDPRRQLEHRGVGRDPRDVARAEVAAQQGRGDADRQAVARLLVARRALLGVPRVRDHRARFDRGVTGHRHDVGRSQALGLQRLDGLEERVDVVADRVALERGVRQFPRGADAVDQRGQPRGDVVVAGVGGVEADRPLQDGGRTGHAEPRHLDRHQPRLGGPAGVHRLDGGAAAEELEGPAGLATTDPQRVDEGVARGTGQQAGGDRGPERPGDRDGLEARRLERARGSQAERDQRLPGGGDGEQQLGARRALALGGGQCGRDDDRAAVDHRRHVRVVELQCVHERAVDQRRVGGGQPRVAADDGRVPGTEAREVGPDRGGARRPAGEADAERVEQVVLRGADDGGGEPADLARGHAVGQDRGQRCGGGGHRTDGARAGISGAAGALIAPAGRSRRRRRRRGRGPSPSAGRCPSCSRRRPAGR